MPKEILGYVRLEWTCPSCGSRNPGPQKTCGNCGAPQPDNVQFEQAAEEKLLAGQAEIARAQAGPDMQCPYCGTRNPAGSGSCSQCGGDLAEAAARASGRVLGAHRSGPAQPLPCPACGAANPPSALQCARCGASLARPEAAPTQPSAGQQARRLPLGILGGLAAALLLICVFAGAFLLRTEEASGVVRGLSWARSIAIEELQPVTHEAWRNEVPAGAKIGACTHKLHHTQQNPAPDAEKVCGTPYTVDKGNGYGEVVQDCEYRVYAGWCEYTVREWVQADEVRRSGDGDDPEWPELHLGRDQRAGPRQETYTITFAGDGRDYTYTTHNAAELARFKVGSRWALRVRGATVVSVEQSNP